ncbi:MAG TPA: hypothetical protein VE644_02595 [Gaiellaceae bacterium]|nr:hypothetical protein [Gaiellaceae bacterium]
MKRRRSGSNLRLRTRILPPPRTRAPLAVIERLPSAGDDPHTGTSDAASEEVIVVERRLERKARNEALLREVNEQIERIDREAESRGWASEEARFEFQCECGADDGSCESRVELTIAEYEAVRAQDDRFVLFPGHETPGLERVVQQNERFVVVDKAAEAEPFVADDPRGAPPR